MFTFPAWDLLFDSKPLALLLNSFDIKDANLVLYLKQSPSLDICCFCPPRIFLSSFRLNWSAFCHHSSGEVLPTHSSPCDRACTVTHSTSLLSKGDPRLAHGTTPPLPCSQGVARVGKGPRPESVLFPRTFLGEARGRRNTAGAKGGSNDQKKDVSRNCLALKRDNTRE